MTREEVLERLASLESVEECRRFFDAHPEWCRVELVEDVCTEVARLVAADLHKARQLATAARWLAEGLDHEPSRALSERSAANTLHFSGESEEAQGLYTSALERFLSLDNDLEAAITRSSALLNLAYLGRYDEVTRWADAARRVIRRLEDRRRLAVLEHNLANILYRQDRWDEALDSYRTAYSEFLALDSPQDVAICLRNIAVCYISLHRFDEALEAYEKSRAYCRQKNLRQLLLEVDYNIAYLHYLRGEYTRSIHLFQAARRRCEEEGDHYHQALCDLDLSEIYLELNLVEEAATLARSALESFEQLRTPYETAKALTNLAVAASRRGQAERAVDLLLRARHIFVREGNQLWPAVIDFYQAVVLYRENRFDEAVSLAKAAREVFAQSALAAKAAMCELLLTEILLDLDRPEEARKVCASALDRLAGLDLPALEHQAHSTLGQVEEAEGHRGAALEAYRRSQSLLEKLRSQLQGEDLKISFVADKHAVYESLVWLSLEEEQVLRRETVFGYIEKAKSRSLADILSFRAHDLPPRAAPDHKLAGRVRTLRKELSWFYRQIDLEQMRGVERSPDEIQRIRQISRDKETELLRSLRELQTADLEFSSLQSGAMVDFETIRRSLPREATLVEYFIARDRIVVCVVDQESLEIRRLAPATRTRRIHRLLQFQLSKLALGYAQVNGTMPLIETATRSHLEALYEALIRPIRELLRNRHLIVAPHDFLHFVPFHALYDGREHLVDHFSISYAPSAGVYHFCTCRAGASEDRSLVLGVADERAPHILEEVRTVAESLPAATLLVGEEASEEMLRRYGAGSRYVHIATHGFFRRDNPMFSAIQLGTSRLSLFDLYDLRLDAELVVLSGCGTGLNAVLGADELVGLTRGLLYAGAQSVLVTLWDVNDASTADFMRRFYLHLSENCNRAEALRRTMRDLRRQYPHPYHWAPFILVGKADGV